MTYQVKSKQYTGYIHRCVAYQDSRVILRFDRALLNESKKAAHRHAATSVKALLRSIGEGLIRCPHPAESQGITPLLTTSRRQSISSVIDYVKNVSTWLAGS